MAEFREAKRNLLAAVDAVGAAYTGWVEGDAGYITRELEEAMEALLETAAELPRSDSCADLMAWIERAGEHWRAWVAEAERTGLVTTLPGPEFWPCVEAVCLAGLDAGRPKTRPLESVAELRRQGVSDHQICAIYGWVDNFGERELWKAREESETPGKHSTSDPAWRNPLDRARLARETAERDLWQETINARDSKLRRLSAGCPETLDELCQQRVSLPQIAKMLRRTEEDILEECRDRGLPEPPGRDPLTGFRNAAEPDIPEAAARALDARARAFRETAEEEAAERQETAPQAAAAVADAGPVQTIEAEIVEHHLAGEAPEAIVKAVSRPGAKVTLAKVKAVLKRYSEDPEAFDEAAE